jgi:hypothetical protein
LVGEDVTNLPEDEKIKRIVAYTQQRLIVVPEGYIVAADGTWLNMQTGDAASLDKYMSVRCAL